MIKYFCFGFFKKELHPHLLDHVCLKATVYVSTPCRILDKDPKQKKESIFNIFGIGSRTAVKTEH